MTRTFAKRWLPLLIGAACLALVVRLFDWPVVAAELWAIDLSRYLLTVPAFVLIIFLRGVRWLQLLGVRPTAARVWRSFLANAVSAGFASFTPMQLGELIKLRIIKIDAQMQLARTLPSFIVERILDLSGLVGVGLAGVAIHYRYPIAAISALFLPIAATATLRYAAKKFTAPLSPRWQPYLEAARQSANPFGTALITIPIWLLNALGWWIAALSIGVHLTYPQAMLLLGGSTLAAIGSMVPAGLGASELSTLGILVFLGFDRAAAESVAIAVRLLTVLLMAIGAVAALMFVAQKYLTDRIAKRSR